jgi:hypothetical protein
MRALRFLGGSLLAAAVVAGCSEVQPTIPGAPDGTTALNRAGEACVVSDDARTRTRTVTASCVNAATRAPDGWTLRVVGVVAPSRPRNEVSPMLTQIENPTQSYVDNTNLIDLSGVGDFTTHTQIGDGTLTVGFNITLEKRSVPASWGTWAVPPFVEPGTPHILFTQGQTALTLSLSQPVTTFGFELGPNPFAFNTFTATYFSGATQVGTITREISGDNGARLMAVTSPTAFDRVVVTGTSDFSIARVRYTAGTTPPGDTINVPIHRAYSGDPPRMGDTINLADQWVYVEILDPLQFRPMGTMSAGPFQSANQVRIGASWANGVPAESYQLLDINNDGRLDFRGRWSRQALQNAGLLTPGFVTLRVWGNDNGQFYRGEIRVFVVADGGIVACSWNNGGIVTHPGGGQGAIAGADVSMSSPDPLNLAGSNVRLNPTTGGPEFRMADDFTVTNPAGCVLTEVVVHGYRTGGAPNWTGANLNIRVGSVTGPVAFSATTTTWEFTGVYRTFNGVLNSADRPVYRIRFSFPNVTLPAGTHWVDWQVEGGTSGWGNYVMLPDPQGGNNTITVLQNGQQMTTGGVWQPTAQAPGAEIPFLLRGPGAAPLSSYGEPVMTRPSGDPAGYSTQRNDRAGN